ncbi:phosphatidylinositol N-acetylglucosaminyltransferase subunit P [Cydia pomonella]|uniref:phosphatidylinositol N-acetylglucosaminyltransferase subunit P n=1 Tax=Cydia pomonella TaxID=82600 RepID=UPI002ADE4234|nr:phosphatidylinositol N-acetylglucosaminyltransferase subunit P [Cydia pomonella]XP_061712315.1 phosphatidylinositol N-acetylglucosaminyltransferase subunit P [Cydia pomonella]
MPEHTPAPTPARSLYGFFMYLFSKTVLVIYCIWAFVPDEYLNYLNIYYYPQKYWATAVPIQFLVTLTLFVFFIYPSINWCMTSNIDSINTITDPHSSYCVTKTDTHFKVPDTCVCTAIDSCFKSRYIATDSEIKENSVPHLHDLDIRYICKKLYLNR